MAKPRIDPIVRFMSHVDKTDRCWLWTGAATGSIRKYGVFAPGGGAVNVYAHRWMYEHAVGSIPEGLEIDHLCRVYLCVNPEHLEPVTHKENRRRARLKVCGRGHDLTDPANERWDENGNRRGCRVCHRDRVRERSRSRGVKERKTGRTEVSKEETRAKDRARYARNKEKMRAQANERYRKNREKINARRRELAREKRMQEE
jgi:hypothetical protein